MTSQKPNPFIGLACNFFVRLGGLLAPARSFERFE
jgi:hypothetical protein